MGEGPSPAVSEPPAPAGAAGPGRADFLFAEQVRNLYRLSLAAYAGTLLCATVALGALWSVLPTSGLLLWAFALAGVMGGRYVLFRAYMRRRPLPSEARRWCSCRSRRTRGFSRRSATGCCTPPARSFARGRSAGLRTCESR